MRGRKKSRKIAELMKKFESHKQRKRPVSESKVLRRGRRRSKIMDALAKNYERNQSTQLTNKGISWILKESKMGSWAEDSVQPFLETRSNVDKSETRRKVQVTYTMTPVYPEQIYFNRVTVQGDELRKEAERRKFKFGALLASKIDKSELGLSVSVSPLKTTQTGKKLVSQSSLGLKIRKGTFMTTEESEDLLRDRDQQFESRMKDTQGNAIQKAKHAFLNQDDRKLRKKLLDALRKKFSQMIVKDKTVEELKEIYSKKEEEKVEKKQARDWMKAAKTTQMDAEGVESSIFQIGKINRNLIER